LQQKTIVWIGRTGLILFGIIISLLVLEVGFRLLYPDPTPRLVNQGLEFHPRYGLAFRPNTEGWNTSLRGEYSTYVKINGKGLRGLEYAYEPAADTYRVLVLGDSFTAGLQVPEAGTFPRLLETRLQAEFPQTNIEVINAGVIGYGTDNQLAYFTDEGYKYQPDLVVLAFFTGNDITDNIWYSLYELEDGRLVRVKATNPAEAGTRAPRWAREDSAFRQVRSFLYANSRLYSVSIELLTLAAIQRLPALARLLVSIGLVEITQPAVNYGNIYAFRYLPEEAWRNTEALIVQLQQEVEAHGSQLLVAILPDETDVDENRRAEIYEAYAHLTKEQAVSGPVPARQLARLLDRHNIQYVQLLPVLQEYQLQTEEPLYFRYDGHWNAAGHSVAGQAIFQYLLNNRGELEAFPEVE
jgi:lysophospholipase L1-like esterase